ncbi:ORF098R [giant sea perch iridovirus - K1]|uniref:ORF098R n=1 Tax=Giant seaperch iridovirus TaxID=176655 RepID=A0A140GBF1_GSIV|nr:ORF098R [giant sea perch iridovirus - K1]
MPETRPAVCLMWPCADCSSRPMLRPNTSDTAAVAWPSAWPTAVLFGHEKTSAPWSNTYTRWPGRIWPSTVCLSVCA